MVAGINGSSALDSPLIRHTKRTSFRYMSTNYYNIGFNAERRNCLRSGFSLVPIHVNNPKQYSVATARVAP